MHEVIKWTAELDLTAFYAETTRRGFINNSSQKAMVDCFQHEHDYAVWMLYENNRAIGSVAAHSFDRVMGPGSYRVLTRVCTFAESRKDKGLITPKRLVAEHQNLTDQFLLPTCINWVNGRGNMYATSNASIVASQRLVHSYYFPTLAKLGIVEKIKDVYYRHTEQTVWQIHPDKFLENLERYPRWI
jgi:hypothetical protein